MWFTAFARVFQCFQVIRPVLFVFGTKFVQVLPAVDTGIMAVRKNDLDGVVTLWLEIEELDFFFTVLQDSLTGSVSLDLCGG